jgi:hypothetical protein
MRQTRLGSLIEVSINIFIGFWINFVANLVVLPLFGLNVTIADNFLIGFIYTFISVARSYVVRRWFEKKIQQAAMRIAHESNR